MNDQATTLRKLKRLVDQSCPPAPINGETFLSQIIRPSPFATVTLIVPDIADATFPPVSSWISGLMQYSPRSCFWDQAAMIEPDTLPLTQVRLRYPVPIRIEAGLTPLTIMPYQPDFSSLIDKPENLRIDFLRHLIRSLKSSSEVWISINARDVKKYQTILHASDAVCVMVPQHPDALFKCYEIVKSIHLSGYFSPIGLLDFTQEKAAPMESSSSKIKIVAKQFLALDLVASGMVLSNCTYIPPETDAGLRGRIAAVDEGSRDFLYCLSENLIYLIPGTF
ncbi:MAG TPA: hypothetical protein DCG57_08080 [Candidatus Riflebacteria bacterium]|jgi:hypothetical protein|nr:hypothetical protein [Candidatus Riflebacteria bacterium]